MNRRRPLPPLSCYRPDPGFVRGNCFFLFAGLTASFVLVRSFTRIREGETLLLPDKTVLLMTPASCLKVYAYATQGARR